MKIAFWCSCKRLILAEWWLLENHPWQNFKSVLNFRHVELTYFIFTENFAKLVNWALVSWTAAFHNMFLRFEVGRTHWQIFFLGWKSIHLETTAAFSQRNNSLTLCMMLNQTQKSSEIWQNGRQILFTLKTDSLVSSSFSSIGFSTTNKLGTLVKTLPCKRGRFRLAPSSFVRWNVRCLSAMERTLQSKVLNKQSILAF